MRGFSLYFTTYLAHIFVKKTAAKQPDLQIFRSENQEVYLAKNNKKYCKLTKTKRENNEKTSIK